MVSCLLPFGRVMIVTTYLLPSGNVDAATFLPMPMLAPDSGSDCDGLLCAFDAATVEESIALWAGSFNNPVATNATPGRYEMVERKGPTNKRTPTRLSAQTVNSATPSKCFHS